MVSIVSYILRPLRLFATLSTVDSRMKNYELTADCADNTDQENPNNP
ncbi:Unannotated [Lentimonas sp. CC19]|nr:Unannotated [Lentimonas sp. CC19]CAA6692228.1 Unannotated [Lentimonas sp. CC10]CAA7070170.1 Unannotated [Lentimonas sp. CC11]